ncbi:methyl-CpG-binding domain-containing protein 6-like [Solanum tuberosum]|uniref:methyl-CpG-binding domain-containing protein 6-like n=1 Tax=Solanum tuberosum TaxID=4113 RepID=UPI00073A3D3A|nr:PREDICTED: methyl-CpG-binding domain-containing protein 6-like [Solanum tuberosum]
MTKADAAISSIPRIIVTNDYFCNDGIPADLLLLSGTYIDVELDVRVEITTPNKGDVSIEGKVSDVIPTKLRIQRKITPMRRVNQEWPKWLRENWRFESKACFTGATTEISDRYYIELVSGDKLRSENEVDYLIKIRGKHKTEKTNINFVVATPSEEKKTRRREA